jgi:hypothetical protein
MRYTECPHTSPGVTLYCARLKNRVQHKLLFASRSFHPDNSPSVALEMLALPQMGATGSNLYIILA